MTYLKGPQPHRKAPTGSRLSNAEELEALQKQVSDLAQKVCCLQKSSIGVMFDSGAVVAPGDQNRIVVPFDAKITGWTILEVSEPPITSSVVVHVGRSTYAAYDTFSNIHGSEPPTLSAAVKGQDLALTTWTTALSAGDILEFLVDSASTAEKVQVYLHLERI